MASTANNGTERDAGGTDRTIASVGSRLAITAGIWSVFGILEASETYVSTRLQGGDRGWGDVLLANMPWWWIWALLTPLCFRLAAAWRLDGPRWKSALLVHFGASIVVALGHIVAGGSLYYHTHGRYLVPSLGTQLHRMIDGYLIVEIVIYWAIIGAYYALEFNRRYREGELATARLAARASQLESRMVEARLDALRMQLNPHFLFNALNAVSGLVRRRENDAAVAMLARLGELLRLTLDGHGEQEVSLERELQFLRRYLGIAQIRFRDRLSVQFDVEEEALAGLVPPLILQPLVENAVRHGIARTPGPGTITIGARLEGESLDLAVRDTGRAGLAEPRQDGAGVGLANTRARLEQMYGKRGSLTIERTGDGVEARVRLPFCRAPQQAIPPAAEPAVAE